MQPTNSNFVESAGGALHRTFAENDCSMIEITENDYYEIARILADVMSDGEFFSGGVIYNCDRYDSRLTATIIIYRDLDDRGVINDIIPVWWEFTTDSNDGQPALNDFSFRNLKSIILQR